MKNLTFCAFLAILLLLLFAVYGCGGTRNVGAIKKDSIHIENTYSQGTKIVLGNTFIYKPIDALKPMWIDGKEYRNAVISSDKSKIVEKWKNRNITKTIVIEKNKTTTRTDNTMLWLGMFLILVVAVWLFIYLQKLKTGIYVF